MRRRVSCVHGGGPQRAPPPAFFFPPAVHSWSQRARCCAHHDLLSAIRCPRCQRPSGWCGGCERLLVANKVAEAENFVRGLLNQDHTARLGCGPLGINEILDHP